MNETKHQPIEVQRSAFTAYQPNRLCTEASLIEWAPGQWPTEFLMRNGGAKPIRFEITLVQRNADQDVMWVSYICLTTGEIANIYND